MVKRNALPSRSSHIQPQSGHLSFPSNSSLSELPEIRQPLSFRQNRNSKSSTDFPAFSQSLPSRHHISHASTHAKPKSPPTPRLPAPPLSSTLPQIPMAVISAILNDLQPTVPAFNITIDSETGLTLIKKVCVKETDAKVEIMQAEGEARIDVLGLVQGVKRWRIHEETKAKIEVMRKESEAVLEIMRNESEAQIWCMKEESRRRVLREDGAATSRGNA